MPDPRRGIGLIMELLRQQDLAPDGRQEAKYLVVKPQDLFFLFCFCDACVLH